MDERVQRAVQAATGQSTEMMIGMYNKYWQPFGLLLTDMEREGMSVNRSAFHQASTKAHCSTCYPPGSILLHCLVASQCCINEPYSNAGA